MSLYTNTATKKAYTALMAAASVGREHAGVDAAHHDHDQQQAPGGLLEGLESLGQLALGRRG
jgi:hypothetical protein